MGRSGVGLRAWVRPGAIRRTIPVSCKPCGRILIVGKPVKSLLFALLISTLTGCSTFKDLDRGLSSSHGQHIDSLIAKIGDPSGQDEADGRKVYVWDSSETVSYTNPTLSINAPSVVYHSGSVDAFRRFADRVGVLGSVTTTWETKVETHFCTITVEVDDSEAVVSAQREGNIDGCERYAAALRE